MKGESGYAKVKVEHGERIFIGTNKGGALKEQSWELLEEDYEYISRFKVVHTSLNSYLESKLKDIKKYTSILSFDFSNRFTDKYLEEICQYSDIACLSCGHLTKMETEILMKRVYWMGAKMIIATMGDRGAGIFYDNQIFWGEAVLANVKDTMGAGDAYIASLLTSVFCKGNRNLEDELTGIIPEAMRHAAVYAAKVCEMEGAFGYGRKVEVTNEI